MTLKANYILPRLYGSSIVPPDGDIPCDYMFIGEAPGVEEDKALIPLLGKSGEKMCTALNEAGLARREVYITYAVKCRPPLDRRPTWEEISEHRPCLEHEISICKPKVIVTLGSIALRSLLNWEKLPSALVNLRHKMLYRRNPGLTRVFATYAPGASLKGSNIYSLIVNDIKRSVQWVESRKRLS